MLAQDTQSYTEATEAEATTKVQNEPTLAYILLAYHQDKDDQIMGVFTSREEVKEVAAHLIRSTITSTTLNDPAWLNRIAGAVNE